ncbi:MULTISPECIES: hypothetical protein [Bradyrhizobium]|uniref:hypothetical protein n=1 Tax=Bradyrhizobium TaxID=374 RepID=UPI0003AA3CC2|nr:hypothetical protein [Bradyrhizobium denitrificans]MCL8484359.1 hypothetical protein [Bradyrhizobium denitrificans]RTM06477.1 MAG: hypothetical protein EKK32_01275 [Bradyrhizobiaceae bacterium]
MTVDISGRLLIWGIRVVAHSRRLGRASVGDLRQVYEQFKVADAVHSLEAMLDVFARTAHAPVELHASGCRCVSLSECRLLQAVAAVQYGCFDIARRRFEQWLPPSAASWIMGPACGFGRIFANAGLMLPIQDAGDTERQATMAMRSWQVGSLTLH